MSASHSLRWLTAGDLPAWREHVAATYRTAFAPPPYLRTERNVQEFLVSFEVHQREPGFQFLGAFTGNPEQLIGFAYLRRCLPGQWWHNAVAPPLRQAGLDFWLDDSYQLVELAVHLGYQRRGIGSDLLDTLIAALPGERLLLSTSAAETPAARLYVERGWQTLLPLFHFPGVSRPYRILGRAP
jgi:ribosomal protein S18 acetylase RimI-like enzyme